MPTKISQLPELNVVDGTEDIVGVSNGVTIRTKLNKVKTLVNKNDVGLGSVDNTSDANKPVSTAQQQALDGKANVTHSHVVGDVTGLQSALDGKAESSHTHQTSDVDGLQTALDAKADVSHAHDLNSVTGLPEALTQKSNVGHSHAKSEVTGLNEDLNALQQQINNKASSVHTHDVESIVGLTEVIDNKIAIAMENQGSSFTTQQYEAIQNIAISAIDSNQHVIVTNLEW